MKVNYRGDLLAPSGYSRAIRAHMRGLIEAGVEISGELSAHDMTQIDFGKHPFWRGRMNSLMRNKALCPVKIWHETPEFFDPDPTQYNIAYTAWETSKIVDYDIDGNPRFNWVKQLNRMDEVWTPAIFEEQVFKNSGVTVPIRVFPHPIDLDRYNPEGTIGNWLVGKDLMNSSHMVFLSVFQFTKRKNPQDLLLAWMSEFGNQKNVSLVIKTYGSDFKDNSRILKAIQDMREGCRLDKMVSNVHLILELIPDEDMAELYRMCDVFVLPSYGEGFGMPYQEAMACGRPVIYTNASAMQEFCHGYPIDCNPEPVSGMLNIPWYNITQEWWKVKVSSLREQMRLAYNDWKSGRLVDLGKEARSRVEKLHSYDIVGKAMRARLEEVVRNIRDGSCRPELAAVWSEALDLPAEVSDTPAG